MTKNTVIMVFIAVLVGSLAVFVANKWLALQSQNLAVVVPDSTKTEVSTIVVASANISFGTTLGAHNIREIAWPKATLPTGYFGKVSEITKGGRRVALASFTPNEPIFKTKVSGADARGSLSAIVTEGMRAVGVRVNDVVGVGGFILPGDRVDVMFTRTDRASQPSTDILIQNARVLAIDQLADEKSNSPSVAKVVTIEVNSVDAQKIALAQTVGSLTLSLRSAGSLDQAPARRIVVDELTSSPSVYEAKFAARNARQNELEKELSALRGKLDNLGKEVKTADAETRKTLQEQIAAILKKLLSKPSKAGPPDVKLLARLAKMEARLRKQANRKDAPPVVEPLPTQDTYQVRVHRKMIVKSYDVPFDSSLRR